MNGLDLFSGIGGLGLALHEWVTPVAYCEIDPFAQSVLLSRMSEGSLPVAPIWDDVKTFSGNLLGGVPVDIIYGGFPCQDLSVAGLRGGISAKRSGLFYEVVRLAKEIKPTFIFMENVAGIFTSGIEEVLQEITALGYDCRWTVLSAENTGAPHQRERFFILAHSYSNGLLSIEELAKSQENVQRGKEGTAGSVESQRSDPPRMLPTNNALQLQGSWVPESEICRVDDGVPYRVHRTKCLGNSVVPAQARQAFKELMGLVDC